MHKRVVGLALGCAGGSLFWLACGSTQTTAKAPMPPVPPAQVSPAPPAGTEPAPSRPAQPAAAEPAPTPSEAVVSGPAADQAFAYFYRKKKVLGMALNTSVHVDRVEVADLDPGTYVKVPLSPGKHAFYSDEDGDTLQLDLEPGREYFFRIELRAGMWKGHGVLKLVDVKEGSEEFEKWQLKLAKDVRKLDMVVTDPRKK